MYTKQDFLKKIQETSLKRNKTAALYHAGDPRIYQMQESMATMLAMLSQQVEVALAEPFIKSRDASVLADAAAKGILFTATPTLINITVENKGDVDLLINSGRKVIDPKGRAYLLTKTVNLISGDVVTLQAIQKETITQTKTVEGSKPFLSVKVEQPEDDDNYISSLRVFVNGDEYTASTDYCNADVDSKVYAVESDEFRDIYVKFGMDGVIGVQPEVDDIITIEKTLTYGEINLDTKAPISFDYIENIEDSNLSMTFESIATQGSAPASLDTLRQLIRYPSIYDENAVYLGEFERLVKLKFPNLAFSAVWNEQREEEVRGANIDSVNAIFCSFVQEGNAVMTEEAQKDAITKVIKTADSSYKIKFVAANESTINVNVTCYISSSFDAGVAQNEIKQTLLGIYGKEAIHKAGTVSIKNKTVTKLLTDSVTALDDSRSDIDVSVDLVSTETNNPEDFVYMTDESITVNIKSIDYSANIWGG